MWLARTQGHVACCGTLLYCSRHAYNHVTTEQEIDLCRDFPWRQLYQREEKENNRHSSLLLWAAFARQRQTELLRPRRGAGGAGRPAHRVRVVSLKQLLPLFGTGQLEESPAGRVVSRSSGHEPALGALALELGVVVLRGWGDESKKTMQFYNRATCDQKLCVMGGQTYLRGALCVPMLCRACGSWAQV